MKRAQAREKKTDDVRGLGQETAADVVVQDGVRSRSPKASHQWVNSHSCSQDSCGMASRISATMHNAAVAAIAPIGTSVKVEMNSPIAATPASMAPTYRATSTARTSADE